MLERVLERLEARPAGQDRWAALCPAHDDRTPSLSIGLGAEDRVLLTCHAGCSVEEIVAGAGLEMTDLFAKNGRSGMPKSLPADQQAKRKIVATYDYVDELGELLFQVCRYEPKDFRQRRPNGNGWTWSLGETRRVLYRLPAIVDADKVYVVEGEKDVHALEAAGVVATCNPAGAGKWKPEFSESLRGKQVVVIADRDEAGRRHARQVAEDLEGVAVDVELYEPAEGHKDAADHLGAGLELEDLVPVLGLETAPDDAHLLEQIAATIRAYVVMSPAQRDVVALWVLHAHTIGAADSTPYLNVSSPEKQSGKSRLLEVLAQLVPRAMEAANVSDAALFRSLGGDGAPATLLFDELDSVFGPKARDREDLRGMVNAGWRRGAKAYRCVGEGSKQEVVAFPVFGAKALAGIGELPETIADRCIPIRLRRRARDEPVKRGRYRDVAAVCGPLREALALWAEGRAEQLEKAEPALPDELSDRAQDGAEPLLAIADLVGSDWPQRAREALIELHAGRDESDDSWGVQLLAAIREAIGKEDRISTADLLDALKDDDEGPWKGWGRTGDGLNKRSLGKLLKPYGIRSRSIRLDSGKTPKGFLREQFEDAWNRYLFAASSLPPRYLPPQRHNGSTEPKTPNIFPPQGEACGGKKTPQTALASQCGDVADRNGVKGEAGGEETPEQITLEEVLEELSEDRQNGAAAELDDDHLAREAVERWGPK